MLNNINTTKNSATTNQNCNISEYPSLDISTYNQSLFEVSINLDKILKEELIKKATLYKMDVFNILAKDGVYTLREKINEYEFLLDVARELGIAWDRSLYDPIGLRQAIDECEAKAKEEEGEGELRKFYLGNLGVY